jgi:hypothetical protein
MDADRFDSVAKRLGTLTSRRAAVGTAVTGGLLSALVLGGASLRHGLSKAVGLVVLVGPAQEMVGATPMP